MALAFAGTAPFGAAILAGLIDPPEGFDARDVALVISQPDRPAGRGRKVSTPAVAQLARERGLPLVQPDRIEHVDDQLRAAGVETIVVAAFGQLIREPMLSDYLMLNVHGSLLPEYRGAAPIERAIMDGRTETGVCIMQMDVGLDTGPVASRAVTPISPEDDAGAVFERCQQLGVTLLHEALAAHDAGTLTFEPQPEDGTYAQKIVAADRSLDLGGAAPQLHDRARALSPHIGAWVELGDTRVTLWRTRALDQVEAPFDAALGHPGVVVHDSSRLVVGCGEGALDVLELQPSGKRRMPAGDWLRGLREPLPSATLP
jgi:methionyl-tRNA formyltransferase